MAADPEARFHQEWLGLAQPVGLVVSPPALLAAQAHPDRNVASRQIALRDLLKVDEDTYRLTDFVKFAIEFLGWPLDHIAGADGGPDLPQDLGVPLPEYGETLTPSLALCDPDAPGRFALLIKVLPDGTSLDDPPPAEGRHWHASPQAKLERLLRETGNPAGLLVHPEAQRLVYAPRGEAAGYVTFPVQALVRTDGRPLLSAVLMLLGSDRVLALPEPQRLPAILAASRKYQNEVSTRLAEQVLDALYELLGGFQAADEHADHRLLGETLREAPEEVYGGLLATILRLVFVLYAEDRDLMSEDPVYLEHYSVTGLYERLREGAAQFPDTMDQRYGAWAQLITLFRMLFDGAAHGEFKLPPRQGHLFDPDTYPFLEGRPRGTARNVGQPIDPPHVTDGVVARVLEKLLILDGDRLSYRALDVEQIGSVYEAMMGFAIEVATGPSIALRPQHVVVNLGELLVVPANDRAKWLKEQTACEVSGPALAALKAAKTVEDLLQALDRKISHRTPRAIPVNAMVLQPTEERRRSGSHYTPRSLTEPIVETTFRPVLARLGPNPRPEEILELNICDPAMGSGAFLVAACRFLGDRLLEAWQAHDCLPKDIPPDEDPQLYARRLVAQRCLYGVDRNPFAVDLAKLSLWLVTLAREHPFTFVDHTLRHGDSLVGFTRQQIASFHWAPERQRRLLTELIEQRPKQAEDLRNEIESLALVDDTREKQRLLRDADGVVQDLRLAGDLLAAAFFCGDSDRDRERLRKEYAASIEAWLSGKADGAELQAVADELREGENPVPAYHWDIEFPEIFARRTPGFDAVVGNPPFAGKNTVAAGNRSGYPEILQALHPESHGNADLVAHFFRRAFELLRTDGAFGLIATNTIAQGDTREAGLRWICTHGGTIFAARRRLKWPGAAAVVVSLVHVAKGVVTPPFLLDEREVGAITAFLFHMGGHESPRPLVANAGKSFQGSIVLGMGFTFDDTDAKGVATPLVEMRRLVEASPRNREVIFPYIGGEEVNTSPTHAHHRYVINFGERSEEECRRNWPELMAIVETKVKPERMKLNREIRRRYWWRFGEPTPALFAAIAGLDRVLVISRVTEHLAFARLPAWMVFADRLIVLPTGGNASFCALQARPHEVWARIFSATLEDRLMYAPSDCFDTFPFPQRWQTAAPLEAAGRTYYEFRAALMVKNNEGLTKTYNRFHDPDERNREILQLRDLHAAMDRAVLEAYGWPDIPTACDFFLDYAIDDEEWGDRKKPWRYRWPDDVRDEVLGRLLALNQERAEREAVAGPGGHGAKKQRPRKTGGSSPLFDTE